MQLSSPAFAANGRIPSRYSCEGENVSPALAWGQVPPGTQSFVLILHDPDAPRRGGFTHWLLYDIPASVRRLREETPRISSVPDAGLQGKNDAGGIGYTGPCPPSGAHRYFARLWALDVASLNLPPGATEGAVRAAMEGHELAMAELMGRFAKRDERAA